MGAQVGPVAGRFPSSDWRSGRHGCENGPFVPCRECVAAWKRRVWRPLWWVVIPRRNNEGCPGPRIADRLSVSVLTVDISQWASVHTYLRIA